MITPDQYFSKVLESSDIEQIDVEAQLTKLAEEAERPLEFVKLAKSFFDMSILQGLEYETTESRWEDAVKIAEGYTAHVEEDKTAAVKVVDRLLEKLAGVAEEYAKDLGLKAEGLSLVKLAGEQAVDALHYNEKRAVLHEELKAEAEKKAESSEGDEKEAVVQELPDFYHRFDDEKAAALLPNPMGRAAQAFYEQN